MNIDELSKSMEAFSGEPDLPGLVAVLQGWKSDDSTALELAARVERYLGNVWFSGEQTHERIHEAWSAFRREAIEGIGGMTMNERLYFFGLFERYESAGAGQRAKIYEKLCAKP